MSVPRLPAVTSTIPARLWLPAGSVALVPTSSDPIDAGRERDPLGQRPADRRGPERIGPGRGTRDARDVQVDVEVHADVEIVDLLGRDARTRVDRAADDQRLDVRRASAACQVAVEFAGSR